MKTLTNASSYKATLTLALLFLLQAISLAQDSTVSSTTKTTTTTQEYTWYTQPWVWIVGGVVLLLLILALVRSSSSATGDNRTDKVTYTKTTEKDS